MQSQPDTVVYFEKFPEYIERSDDNFDDLPQPEPQKSSTPSLWSLEYYQQFFDIDTSDIRDRIIYSLLLSKNQSYKTTIQFRPDIYGPFWISITLIFLIAISGNIANYLQYSNQTYHWKYQFHLVSQAAFAIFLYVCVVPVVYWGIVKGSVRNISDLEDNSDPMPRILEIICFYGYSLAVFVPTSILWTIQVPLFQWLLVLTAAGLSGSVLYKSLTPFFQLSNLTIFLQIGCICSHVVMSASFLLHFFHIP